MDKKTETKTRFRQESDKKIVAFLTFIYYKY
uniref:Uncharacterized protein n=1 Tax=Siphoviridae sp. ctbrg2 TaxID=2823589 RepID=A0A8S5LGD8_9CAUD|nr:MAG TPA: hypothetical protein [Siphoviridae sp. ctbrg2]